MSADEVHQQRARLLQNQGRHQQAVEEWTQALAASPNSPVALSNRALCLCALDKFDEAQADADAAVALVPDWGDAHYVRAIVLRDRGKLREAAVAATEAVRLDPEDANDHALVAELALAGDKAAEALVACDAGLAVQPDHLGCINLRAIALRRLGRLQEADAAVAGALQRAPTNASAHANQGWSLLHQGDYRAAETHFLEALRLKPDLSWARQGLLASLKARSLLYRQVLKYFLWMSRVRSSVGRGVIIGSYIAFRLILYCLSGTPFFWPALILLYAVLLMTWFGDPLGDLTLFTHPIGRHALSRDQRRGAMLVAGGLVVAGLVGVLTLCYRHHREWFLLLFAMFLTVFATMIGSLIFRSAKGWPRWLNTAFSVFPALLAAVLLLSFFAVAAPMPPTPLRQAEEGAVRLLSLVPAGGVGILGILLFAIMIFSQIVASRRSVN